MDVERIIYSLKNSSKVFKCQLFLELQWTEFRATTHLRIKNDDLKINIMLHVVFLQIYLTMIKSIKLRDA